ncbi:MAG: efflux RND transporter periplasmic adaptor subunit [Peptococcaceae bacterium]|nr:efflux RND transporter periplasmic adaptor subunit [Peptococcaceae bacterium]
MNNKKKIYIVLVLMLAALLGITAYYWYNNANYVKTEDAKVDGPIVKVSPQVSGRIISIYVEEGEKVVAGQALARLDDALLSSGINPDLAVVRAPADGVVIRKIANPGEMAVPGQTMLMIVDPYSLYITANIEETKLASVRPGQKVDVTVDAIPGQKFAGRVEKIGDASLSAFTLLPATNTSGSFTKVVQRIPVKIVVEDFKGCQFLYGTNGFVKIHIKQVVS